MDSVLVLEIHHPTMSMLWGNRGRHKRGKKEIITCVDVTCMKYFVSACGDVSTESTGIHGSMYPYISTKCTGVHEVMSTDESTVNTVIHGRMNTYDKYGR